MGVRHVIPLADPARAFKPKDKPRVERAMPYVRDSFWRGREFTSLQQMQAAALTWCRQVANVRSHRSLDGASPVSVFDAVEAAALKPLPHNDFVLATWSTGKVGPDCHVKVGKALYSAPWKLIGQQVDARAAGNTVQILHQGTVVATHVQLLRGRATTSNTCGTHSRRLTAKTSTYDENWPDAAPAQATTQLTSLQSQQRRDQQERGHIPSQPAITTGVGKTHVAQARGHLVARRGGEVRFAKTSRVLADLAGGHADRTWGARVREYIRPTALILDDFGLREHTAAQADDLYELISDRAVNHRPLILTSNRRPLDWYPLFPNPVVAESLLDRLINTSHQVLMDGPSYRPRKRPGRPDSTPPPAAG